MDAQQRRIILSAPAIGLEIRGEVFEQSGFGVLLLRATSPRLEQFRGRASLHCGVELGFEVGVSKRCHLDMDMRMGAHVLIGHILPDGLLRIEGLDVPPMNGDITRATRIIPACCKTEEDEKCEPSRKETEGCCHHCSPEKSATLHDDSPVNSPSHWYLLRRGNDGISSGKMVTMYWRVFDRISGIHHPFSCCLLFLLLSPEGMSNLDEASGVFDNT